MTPPLELFGKGGCRPGSTSDVIIHTRRYLLKYLDELEVLLRHNEVLVLLYEAYATAAQIEDRINAKLCGSISPCYKLN